PDDADPTQEFADAMAAGGLAADLRAPVLLTTSSSLATSTRQHLQDSAIDSVLVMGGEQAIAPTVVDELEAMGLAVQRIGGDDRFQTAVAVAEHRGLDDPAQVDRLLLVEGQAPLSWISGFTVAAHAAQFDGPIVLSNGPALPPATLGYLSAWQDDTVSPRPVLVCVAPGLDTAPQACDAARDQLGTSDTPEPEPTPTTPPARPAPPPAPPRLTERLDETGVALAAAGTGLRHRGTGAISLAGIPDGAVIRRAILVWAALYLPSQGVPGNTIRVNGTTVAADLTTAVSQSLCWNGSLGEGEVVEWHDRTIGFAADLTPLLDGDGNALVTGTGMYVIDGHPSGGVDDSDEAGIAADEFPQTDGATLIVLYETPGTDGRVLLDLEFGALDGNPDVTLARSFADLNAPGGPSRLLVVGPDGQTDAGERLRIAARAEAIDINGDPFFFFVEQFEDDTFNGSDPLADPAFNRYDKFDNLLGPLGNLWDTDFFDVTTLLPQSRDQMSVELTPQNSTVVIPSDSHLVVDIPPDCIGISAVGLELLPAAEPDPGPSED
ncbi:MAG TPA: cell wall-binding repeat-containing protein, partial [Euzebya sp.]|nr:cell wall-binding repeat-containing protein [Euzebya sp.]